MLSTSYSVGILDLRGNDIHSDGIRSISSLLCTPDTCIQSLYLEWNHTGDRNGIELLCDALQHNGTCTHVRRTRGHEKSRRGTQKWHEMQSGWEKP